MDKPLKKLIYPVLILTALIALSVVHAQQMNCSRQIDLTDGLELPLGYNALFAGSGECMLCHNSITDAMGNSIGILDDWRSTMMANASKDPFWRAKVSHETLVNPGHSEVLEDICTRCHAPLGHFNAHHLGAEHYAVMEMVTDSLALDGVSCTLCHQITTETLGANSGMLLIGENKTIWGPYADPLQMPMLNFTGYTPVHGNHITSSALCGSCHTLITHSVDLDGNPTGCTFVEQSIFQEWKNSQYPESGQTCQSCHIPRIHDTVKISSRPPWLDGRSPFGKHHLAGANVFMQTILQNNIVSLGITADVIHFDSTINRTAHLLTQESVALEVTEINRTTDTLFASISIENLAGHKLPTGFPSRRIFIEIVATNDDGDTLLHSGKLDEHYFLEGEDAEFEIHHQVIDSDEKVQIYEMVAGDVDGQVTTVLERAYSHLKDNRLPPAGFTSSHASYDTAAIAGLALTDPDFNSLDGEEGSGSDHISVKIPAEGIQERIDITVRVYYQTVPPKWLEEMFSHSSAEIDTWKDLYYDADRQPILLAEDHLTSIPTNLSPKTNPVITVYPNPASNRIIVRMENTPGLKYCSVYQLNGTKIKSFEFSGEEQSLEMDGVHGILLFKLSTPEFGTFTRKVVMN
ncbi:MAG: T9SS type A sorting domain-containing protein [bacterium]